jgi:taurine dioxygenase
MVRNFTVNAMQVGAVVVGLADGAEADPEVQAELYAAWLEHGVLLFENIDSIEKHLAISQCFGELEIHPFPPARSPEHPLLIEIGGDKRSQAYVYDETDLRINRIPWHRDTAYSPDICKGAMLRMVEVPATEGETMVCDTAAAYDALPEDMKARLDGLEYKATLQLTPMQQTRPGAFWKTVRPASPEEAPDWINPIDIGIIANYPPVIHPAMLVHPESARKCIFLSPTYVDFFLGMEAAESRELLEYLVDHMLQPRFVLKHKWTANEAMVWDNRRMMHSSPGNTPDQRRRGLRTTLAGATRTGRYFEAGAQPAGNAPAIMD